MQKAEGRTQIDGQVAKRRALMVGAALVMVGSLAVILMAVSGGGCSARSSPAMASTNGSSTPSMPTVATNPPTDAVTNPVPDPPAANGTTIEKPAPAPEVSRQPTRDITFDTIKFDMQKEEPFLRTMITPAIEKLANSKIRIRGYILPSFQQNGITQFVLVRDNMQCCFGPGAALFDCVVVKMEDGKSTDFTTRPVAVEGVFSIDELRGPDDKCLAIYHLQAEKVQ
jgi:hypothetical protein